MTCNIFPTARKTKATFLLLEIYGKTNMHRIMILLSLTACLGLDQTSVGVEGSLSFIRFSIYLK